MNTLVYRALTGFFFISGMASSHLAAAETGLETTTVAYRKVDGHEILADVYRPKGKELRPVIVYIHGGSLMFGNRTNIEHYPKTPTFSTLRFAEDYGYAVVSIDYRLAPETKLPDIISDIEAAFTWLGDEGAQRFHLDPNRMVVLGASAGGYLALVSGYRAAPKPKALVALYGFGEINADWYAKPNPHPRYNAKKITREEAMSQIYETVVSDDREREGPVDSVYLYYVQNGWLRGISGFDGLKTLAKDIAAYEPIKNVTRAYPPTVLVHGTQDTNVPFEQSAKMSEQFKKHGVPYILLPINNGEHGFEGGDPMQIEGAHVAMMQFMRKYLDPQ